MIDCKIQGRRVFVEDKEDCQNINAALTIKVPGSEHTRLFKQGKWDGYRKFFNWQYRYFSIGLMPYVSRFLKDTFNVLEHDEPDYGQFDFIPFKVNNEYALREAQVNAIRLLLLAKGGLAAMATNAGKTAVITGLVLSMLKGERSKVKNILILEGNEQLLVQVQKEIYDSIGMTPHATIAGVIDFGNATIGMVQTINNILNRVDNQKDTEADAAFFDWLCTVDAVIVDECHHGAAETYQKIMTIAKEAMRFGFSGTIPPDITLKGIEIREIFGEVLCEVSNAELINQGISATPKIHLVEYDTCLEGKLEPFKKIVQKQCMKPMFEGYGRDGKKIMKFGFSVPLFTNKVKEFVMNYAVKQNMEYWALIRKIVDKYPDESVVILVDWVDLCEALAEYLGVTAFHSNTKNRAQVLADFKSGKIKKIVVTSVLDEGISIDRIKVLIFGAVGSSVRQFLQRIGRGLRKKEGDNTLLVYDFVRYGHKYLLEPSKRRIALWQSQGFETVFEEDI